MNYNQVIVVEGYHDEQKIKSVFPGIDCIITNGSEISKETLNLIYELSFKKDVILFLDPDFPGKKITKEILDTKGNFKLAYISKDKAMSNNGKKVGVEHAQTKDIEEALENFVSINYGNYKISNLDLLKRGITNNKNSMKLRKYLCKELNIPFCNGKTLLKYLNMLDIEIERIDELINEFKS